MNKLILGLLLIPSLSFGQGEKITLTSPETKPNNTTYSVERIIIDDKSGQLTIQLVGDNGEPISCSYNPTTNPTGSFLILNLKKANLSSTYLNNATTGSLYQRIYHRLVIMNEAPQVCGRSLVGSLTGSPQ